MTGAELTDVLKSYIVPFVFPALGTLSVVLVNDYLKSKSNAKKVNLDDLLFLRELAETTRELAVKYWCTQYKTQNEQKADEARIAGAMHGCSVIISSLKTIKDGKKQDLVVRLSTFRRTCTSGSFGSVGRPVDADVLKDIEADGRAFEASVLSCRWG